MKKYIFNNRESTDMRMNPTFLVKPVVKGNLHCCYENSFIETCDNSSRVSRLNDMREGVEEATIEEYNELLYQQPVFYLQERFTEVMPGLEWNGLLLFALYGDRAQIARLVKDKQKELHVVLAHPDPDNERYYILVDTECGGGSEEEHDKWSEDVRDMILKRYFHKVQCLDMSFFSRALPSSMYDILDRDVLFGKPVRYRYGRTMSWMEVLTRFARTITRKLAELVRKP